MLHSAKISIYDIFCELFPFHVEKMGLFFE